METFVTHQVSHPQGAELVAFHPEYMVAVFQVEVDPATGKLLVEEGHDNPRLEVFLHIGPIHLYHNGKIALEPKLGQTSRAQRAKKVNLRGRSGQKNLYVYRTKPPDP